MRLMASSTAVRNRARHVVVDQEYAGQRVDNFLARELPRAPRALLYRMLRTGQVRVNSGRVRQGHRLAAGDDVRLPPIDLPAVAPTPARGPTWASRIEHWVLVEHPGWLALDKPAGIAVHGGSGVAWGLIEALRRVRPLERGLELAHRLDRDTSGCLLVARRRGALHRLHAALREGRVDKRYLLVAEGCWPPDRVVVDVPLSRFTRRGGERVVRPDEHGRAARTRFRVLASNDVASLVEAQPLTGRTHQIRVHAAAAGHPIAGDRKYGPTGDESRLRAFGVERLLLHAAGLVFPDPGGGAGTERVHAPVPTRMRRVITELGFGTALDRADDKPGSVNAARHGGRRSNATPRGKGARNGKGS